MKINRVAALGAVLFGLSMLIALSAPARAEGVERVYYIAADPVVWDYTPEGYNMITGQPFGEEEAFRTERGDYRIGSKFKKALYREYTDDTFTTLKKRDADWQHLGWLGPLIRAEVGDTIKVVFKNNVEFPASVHPHGVFYEKDSEGALYADDSEGADKADDAVPPGGTHVYRWNVPERAGPPEGGLSTAFWMYHSHTNEARDVNAGLIGPMLITAKGRAGDGTLRPDDVDREFIVAFMSEEESMSWYVEENINTYMGKPEDITLMRDQFGSIVVIPPDDSGVEEGFLPRDSLNGFSYGNMPMPTLRTGERVRWYIMAGTNFEVHAPHWHGNVLTKGNMRLDVMELNTMGMQVADMVPDAEGVFLFHCHVTNHFIGGMSARYRVLPAGAPSVGDQ